MVLSPPILAILTIAGASAIGFLVALLARRDAPAAPDSKSGAPGAAGSGPTSWVRGLEKTRGSLARRLLDAWTDRGESETWLAGVEETLLSSDVGAHATAQLLERWRVEVREAGDVAAVRGIVEKGVADLLRSEAPPAVESSPQVVLVVGVNGVGKTTTIGKLAYRLKAEGKAVLLVAGDTFRAAAIEQLSSWAERLGVDLVKHQDGADPSAVVFDGVQAGLSRSVDVVIIDTAGRLHVKTNLMEEVKKISRTIQRLVPGAPHEVLLVIDATTGQNALAQARVFNQALGVSGVVLTKLDGTAKGGVALAIRSELGLPLRYVGLGERPQDLAEFDADEFAAALFNDLD
jgi:fused signal recognition particle receptor